MKWLGWVFLFLVISTVEVKTQPTVNPPNYGRGGYDERDYGYGERKYDRDRDRGYDQRYGYDNYHRHRYYGHRHCDYIGSVRVCQ